MIYAYFQGVNITISDKIMGNNEQLKQKACII